MDMVSNQTHKVDRSELEKYPETKFKDKKRKELMDV